MRWRGTHAARAAVLVVLALATVALAGPSSGTAHAESIWVTPTEGVAGTPITIKGDLLNCYETGPGPLSGTWGLPDTITIYWDPHPLPVASGTDPNDVSGLQAIGAWTKGDTTGIHAQFTVPGGTKPGHYRFVAKLDPQCNSMGMKDGKPTQLTDEPSYMGAVFCVLAAEGAPCVDAAAVVEPGADSPTAGGGGGVSGVTIAVVGGLVTITIGGLVVRARRQQLPSVEHLPEPCRGLGGAVNAVASNVQILERIDERLGEEIALRTRTQKKNLIKAALGSMVQTTMIVGGGVAEVSAARKAALAARTGLGVMEHWAPPGSLSAKLREALALAETALTTVRNQIDDLARTAGRFANSGLEIVAQRPAVIRAKQAIAELTPGLEQAEQVVRRLLGSDPATSPRARYARAEGLLNGIDPAWGWQRVAEIDRLEDGIITARNQLTNLLENAKKGGQPLDGWMEEYLALGKEIELFTTKEAGSTMSPEFARLVDRKKELESLGARWELSQAAEYRHQIELKMIEKGKVEAALKQHNDMVAKVMADHEKALIDLQNLEAAEGRLTQIQQRYASATEALNEAEQQAQDELRREHQRVLRQLDDARAREKELVRQRDQVRASVESEQGASSAAHAGSSAPSPGVIRTGLTIATEILLGPEIQSTEEVGTIIREGQEYLHLTEARQRAVRARIQSEQLRLDGLRQALARCVAEQEGS